MTFALIAVLLVLAFSDLAARSAINALKGYATDHLPRLITKLAEDQRIVATIMLAQKAEIDELRALVTTLQRQDELRDVMKALQRQVSTFPED